MGLWPRKYRAHRSVRPSGNNTGMMSRALGGASFGRGAGKLAGRWSGKLTGKLCDKLAAHPVARLCSRRSLAGPSVARNGQRNVGGGLHRAEDQRRMHLVPLQLLVATLRLRRNIPRAMGQRRPSDRAGHARLKLCRRSQPRHATRNRRNHPFTKINRQRFSHVSRPPQLGRSLSQSQADSGIPQRFTAVGKCPNTESPRPHGMFAVTEDDTTVIRVAFEVWCRTVRHRRGAARLSRNRGQRASMGMCPGHRRLRRRRRPHQTWYATPWRSSEAVLLISYAQ